MVSRHSMLYRMLVRRTQSLTSCMAVRVIAFMGMENRFSETTQYAAGYGLQNKPGFSGGFFGIIE